MPQFSIKCKNLPKMPRNRTVMVHAVLPRCYILLAVMPPPPPPIKANVRKANVRKA